MFFPPLRRLLGETLRIGRGHSREAGPASAQVAHGPQSIRNFGVDP
jgi:hypothetical protein